VSESDILLSLGLGFLCSKKCGTRAYNMHLSNKNMQKYSLKIVKYAKICAYNMGVILKESKKERVIKLM